MVLQRTPSPSTASSTESVYLIPSGNVSFENLTSQNIPIPDITVKAFVNSSIGANDTWNLEYQSASQTHPPALYIEPRLLTFSDSRIITTSSLQDKISITLQAHSGIYDFYFGPQSFDVNVSS